MKCNWINGLREFSIIENFFASLPYSRKDVVLGIGDDAALVDVPPGKLLVSSIDTLVEGIHFFEEMPAHALGYKSLAVNLSDLAAMGATPCWVSLAITLPTAEESWLELFTQGFSLLLEKFKLQLIGGDTTQGPLSITVQVLGVIEPDKVLRRDAAKIGDIIYVTGSLGDAAFALNALQYHQQTIPDLLHRLYYPTPRVEEGIALGGIANAAIDISDGLLADLNHILTRSCLGAVIYPEKLPLSPWLCQSASFERSMRYALSGGDDYELCFTVSPSKEQELQNVLRAINCSYTPIGIVGAEKGLYVENAQGRKLASILGYQHL